MSDAVSIKGVLTREELDGLTALAARRGLSPNDVLKQAIATEVLLSEAVGPGDKVLIHKPDHTTRQVIFTRS